MNCEYCQVEIKDPGNDSYMHCHDSGKEVCKKCWEDCCFPQITEYVAAFLDPRGECEETLRDICKRRAWHFYFDDHAWLSNKLFEYFKSDIGLLDVEDYEERHAQSVGGWHA